MTTLILDSDIRDWVVLPLFVIMVATGLLRHYVSLLLKNDPTKCGSIAQRAQSLLRSTSKLRTGSSNYVCNWKFAARRQQYIQLLKDEAAWVVEEEADQKARAEEDAALAKQAAAAKGEEGDASAAPATPATPAADDPMAAMMNPMSMMKGNMVFMVQNMVMMQGISHFFSGFILLKIPFPLTVGFKPMFQRGLVVENNALDTSYVSSVSWYFLVMFGLRGFFRLAIGDPSPESKTSHRLQTKLGMMPQAMNPAAGNPDAAALSKNLSQEAENLEYFLKVPPKTRTIDTVEKRLLRERYPTKNKKSSVDTSAAGISSSIVSDDFLTKKKKKKQ